jgi:TonB family protein
MVRVEVSPEGRVAHPRVVSSTVGDLRLERCVLAAAADIGVQPPESGKAGTVSFPVRFTAP